MSAEQLFSFLNAIALVAWLLIAVFPRRPLVVQTIAGTVIPAFFAAAYIAMIASAWGGSEGSFSSLQASQRCSRVRGSCSRDGRTTWRSTFSLASGKSATRRRAASRT